jgi:DNA mismatch repair protein MutS2
MTVALADCEMVRAAETPAARTPPVIPQGVTLAAADKDRAPAEINLIGRTTEEAIGLLDKFLDDAVLAGHREVRIVHGHGTGRLRAAVASYLGDHPQVVSHRAADPRSGGAGATVAVLREE